MIYNPPVNILSSIQQRTFLQIYIYISQSKAKKKQKK